LLHAECVGDRSDRGGELDAGGAGPAKQGLNLVKPGALHEPLLVHYPLALFRKPGVGGREDGVGEHAGATGCVRRGGVDLGEHQRDARPPSPACRRGGGERLGIARPRQVAAQRQVDRELADEDVGRRANHVAVLHEHLEAPALGVGEPALHSVDVAEENVHSRAIDGKPGAAVHDRAPLAQR
jgi:hypothetical protein